MKKLFVSKAAVSVSTAVLMATSLLGPVISAASANKLSLSPNTYEVKPGDRITLSLDYTPSDTGAAGFTINVHYDPEMADVFVPDDDLASGSAFSVVTNYEAGYGVVKIVGANMAGTNVKKAAQVTTLTFDVKDSADGSLCFWADVENMIADGANGYVNADYSVPTQASPVAVKVNSPKKTTTTTTTATTTTTTTTTKATTTKAKTTTTAKATTAKAATTTKAVTTTKKSVTEQSYEDVEPQPAMEEPEETTVVTTVSKSAEQAETQPQEAVTEAPAVTSVSSAETEPEPVEQPAEPEPADEQQEEQSAPIEETLFTYSQSGGDFNSESTVQYCFNIADYVREMTGIADIEIKLSTSGNISGAIGVGTSDGQWVSFENSTTDEDSDTWVAENVDLSTLNGSAALQFYYIKDGSEITIENVSVTPFGAADEQTDPEPVLSPEEPEGQPEEEPSEQPEETPVSESDEPEQTPIEDETPQPEQQPVEEPEDPPAEQAQPVPTAGDTLGAEGTAPEEPENTPSAQVTPEQVEKTLGDEVVQAGSSPQTGDSSNGVDTVRTILMLVSALVIVYSGAALVLNKFVFDKK